jgi:hypothetical protein
LAKDLDRSKRISIINRDFMAGKMIIISKILLYIVVVALVGTFSVNCEEAPPIKDIAKVFLDSEPPVIVYSITYYYSYSIDYVIGHSTFTIPFEKIHKLEIYNEKGKYYINITDVDMNTIERRLLGHLSYIGGTSDDNGIKGQFSAYAPDYSKIVIVGINETTNTEEKKEIIHLIPSSPSQKVEPQECENGICKKHQALTPTNLLLLITVDNPLALNEGASSENAESAKQWLYQGNDYYNNSSYEEALNCYKKAIALVNNSPALWYYKGDALYQMQKYADAVLAYKKATDLAPNFLEAWNNLAVSYTKLGLNDEAKAALAEMQKLKSNNNA